ncbi:uncharacterized protein MYCFIDRAFT_179091 [Pseudocercospora fijiensis CIRAD86]|uniref:Uncharacterized protein n=1 Tax=Pseudocercospora fijiensis (strain CIRAD86) TaxID=383855 RepID=M3AJB1_PSEFD|nr:uncharacterized protein MYCFIDRAFT_179091 [Pseudocercospora fijiensis CIRAD86]EME77572.1 hypothetical protein MYCFIDRAFT_179091 [Pseudocercospora fijiensis CIRAD86]
MRYIFAKPRDYSHARLLLSTSRALVLDTRAEHRGCVGYHDGRCPASGKRLLESSSVGNPREPTDVSRFKTRRYTEHAVQSVRVGRPIRTRFDNNAIFAPSNCVVNSSLTIWGNSHTDNFHHGLNYTMEASNMHMVVESDVGLDKPQWNHAGQFEHETRRLSTITHKTCYDCLPSPQSRRRTERSLGSWRRGTASSHLCSALPHFSSCSDSFTTTTGTRTSRDIGNKCKCSYQEVSGGYTYHLALKLARKIHNHTMQTHFAHRGCRSSRLGTRKPSDLQVLGRRSSQPNHHCGDRRQGTWMRKLRRLGLEAFDVTFCRIVYVFKSNGMNAEPARSEDITGTQPIQFHSILVLMTMISIFSTPTQQVNQRIQGCTVQAGSLAMASNNVFLDLGEFCPQWWVSRDGQEQIIDRHSKSHQRPNCSGAQTGIICLRRTISRTSSLGKEYIEHGDLSVSQAIWAVETSSRTPTTFTALTSHSRNRNACNIAFAECIQHDAATSHGCYS